MSLSNSSRDIDNPRPVRSSVSEQPHRGKNMATIATIRADAPRVNRRRWARRASQTSSTSLLCVSLNVGSELSVMGLISSSHRTASNVQNLSPKGRNLVVPDESLRGLGSQRSNGDHIRGRPRAGCVHGPDTNRIGDSILHTGDENRAVHRCGRPRCP